MVCRCFEGERGFTLIELLVVLAVISVLAVIGTTQATRYVRAADASEAVDKAAEIVAAIAHYAESHPGVGDADLKVSINNNSELSTSCSSGCLTTLVPMVALQSDHEWSYSVDAEVALATGFLALCVTATRDSRKVYYSYPNKSENAGWTEYAFKGSYIDADVAVTAGGNCLSSGGATTSDQG